MGKVIMNAAVSLDGFIADETGGVGPLFDYYNNGDTEPLATSSANSASAPPPRPTCSAVTHLIYRVA